MHEHKKSVISVSSVITSALVTDQSIPCLLGNCYAHQQFPLSGLKSHHSLCCCRPWPKATVLVLVGPGLMVLDSSKHWPWHGMALAIIPWPLRPPKRPMLGAVRRLVSAETVTIVLHPLRPAPMCLGIVRLLARVLALAGPVFMVL